jgi:hypothetical protein
VIKKMIENKMRNERGFVVLTAIVLMALMLTLGLALLKIVDSQARQSRVDRTRESAFNLAEGLLYAESQLLQQNWPTKAPCAGNVKSCGYRPLDAGGNAVANAECNETVSAFSTNLNQCPSPGELVGAGKAFNNIDDVVQGATWKVQVRDDIGGSPTFNPTYVKGTQAGQVDASVAGCGLGGTTAGICTYDANGDRKMWVRVDATVRGKTRSLVALLQLETFKITLKQNAVTGGAANFSNSGSKTIVDATNSQVVVRCAPSPSTTSTTAMAIGDNKLVVGDVTGFDPGGSQVIALDVGNANQYELRTVAKNGVNGKTITFTTPVSKTHAVGALVQLAPDPKANSCENWDPSKSPDQLKPPAAYTSDPAYPPLMTTAQVDALVTNGIGVVTYTNSCPPNTNAGWSGYIIIDNPNANCDINPPSSANINSSASPGFVIVRRGTLSNSGNADYYGLLYVVNQNPFPGVTSAGPNDPPVLSLSGNSTVYGGTAVDGFGKIVIGSAQGADKCPPPSGNGPCATIVFLPLAFNPPGAGGAAGLVQNTWRELSASQ